MQYKYKYKKETQIQIQICIYKYNLLQLQVILLCFNLYELSPTNAASAPDRHIQPSGEEDASLYFVHK